MDLLSESHLELVQRLEKGVLILPLYKIHRAKLTGRQPVSFICYYSWNAPPWSPHLSGSSLQRLLSRPTACGVSDFLLPAFGDSLCFSSVWVSVLGSYASLFLGWLHFGRTHLPVVSWERVDGWWLGCETQWKENLSFPISLLTTLLSKFTRTLLTSDMWVLFPPHQAILQFLWTTI